MLCASQRASWALRGGEEAGKVARRTMEAESQSEALLVGSPLWPEKVLDRINMHAGTQSKYLERNLMWRET